MKKILLYTFIGIVISLGGCKNMLDENVYGLSTSEEMLQNPDNVVALMGQAYADLMWVPDHWGCYGLNTLSADEACNPVRNPGNDWWDDGYWIDINTHTWMPEGQSFETVWRHMNSGAVLCNKILAQIASFESSLDPDLYKQYKAELVTVRSYYYYLLFDCFGRIPYSEMMDTTVTPQCEVPVVWNKLVTALEENVEYLPANVDASTYGRCTKWMGYAFLTRLYLNAESFGITPQNCGIKGINTPIDFYNRCLSYCEKIIDSGIYQIEPNFFTNFKIYNEDSKENIFAIVMNGDTNFNYQDDPGAGSNKFRVSLLSLKYAFQQCWGTIDKPWNGFCARPSFLNRYKYDDGTGVKRFFIDRRGPCDSTLATGGTHIDFDVEPWGWFLGPIFDKTLVNDPTLSDAQKVYIQTDKGNAPAYVTMNVSSLTDATHYEGACFLKYQVEKNATLNKYNENDFVVFRYADILYTAAECFLRGATSTTRTFTQLLGSEEFQRIRTRVGVGAYTTSELTLEELCDERGREFAWENIRRRDLIRFGKFNKPSYVQFITNTDPTRNWFPIPAKMIETSGGKWTQNAGY